MKNSITRISSKGQIVVPKDVRDRLKIEDGDSFVVVNYKGTVVLKRINEDLEQDEIEFLDRIDDKSKTEEPKKKEGESKTKEENIHYRSYIH